MIGQTIDQSVEVEDVIEGQKFGKSPPPTEIDDDGYGDDRNDDRGQPAPAVSNARLAMLIFLGAEAMFFAGLISAFLVFRFGNLVWPPLMQPRLPVEVTGLNTLILLFSGYTMFQAYRSTQNGRWQGLLTWLKATALLGATFLAIQGWEWVKLLNFGLTPASGIYGSIFYVLIGCHGVHVLGALIWLFMVLGKIRKKRLDIDKTSPAKSKAFYRLADPNSGQKYTGFELCRMYWYFVVGLWPLLYVLVYLS